MRRELTGKDYGRITAIVLAFLLLACGMLWGLPIWNVWSEGMSGAAALRRAESEKLIMIEQAKAEVEAATLRAQAIEAVGEAVKRYPEYRYQEYIGAFASALENGDIRQIIYVPTEAGIPILEAGRVGGVR